MIFVVTGPSGVGKSTLVKHVLEKTDKVAFSISHTTRPKRDSEREGKDYYFVSVPEFEKMIEEDRFAEWAVVHGNYYGTAKSEIEKKGKKRDLVLDVDIQGARQIKQKYSEAVFVFIVPPVFPELKKRLEARGEESKNSIERRLQAAGREMNSYSEFDYIIINDELEKAVDEFVSVVRAERCRLEKRKREVERILHTFEGE
ncbi:MAG: guanylate kinase [Candidatus Aminicenantales bacterium]